MAESNVIGGNRFTSSQLPFYVNSLTGQTAPVASVVTFTPATTGVFQAGGGLVVTSYTSGSITLQVSYTDDSGTARTATMIFQTTAGTATTSAGATGAFFGNDLNFRAQGATQ